MKYIKKRLKKIHEMYQWNGEYDDVVGKCPPTSDAVCSHCKRWFSEHGVMHCTYSDPRYVCPTDWIVKTDGGHDKLTNGHVIRNYEDV